YSADLFEPATAGRLVRHFANLLAGVCADADARLSDLPLLDEAERQQVLFDFNPPPTDFPRDAAVHSLFEEQVRRAPGAVALESGQTRWTYAHVHDRADRLVGVLGRRGR